MVWIVDDDPILADLTARRLRQLGIQAAPRTVLPRRIEPDVGLVIDLSSYQSLPPDQQIEVLMTNPIIISGSSRGITRAAPQATGRVDFLLKPVDFEQLASLLRHRGS